jgi:hypothetical protein
MRLADDPESGDFKNLEGQKYYNYTLRRLKYRQEITKQDTVWKCTLTQLEENNVKCRTQVNSRNVDKNAKEEGLEVSSQLHSAAVG